MPKLKEENCVVNHALFLIKELSACLKLLSKADFTDELREKMINLSQEMINVTL